MIKLGLIGYPLEHSLSPLLHRAGLASKGLEGEYCLYPVLPGDIRGLSIMIDEIRQERIVGLNVTIPHKQAVLPLLDEVSLAADSIGAVNTMFLRDGKLIGENTDASGFLDDLYKNFPDFSIYKRPAAVILGAGGSARAVIYALAQRGWRIYLSARRIEQADKLASLYPEVVRGVGGLPIPSWADIENKLEGRINLLVNTTPVGMYPKIDENPWQATVPIPSYVNVYDLVYNPAITQLITMARQQGCKAVNGIGMLVEQAALALELWLGLSVSRAEMRAAINIHP